MHFLGSWVDAGLFTFLYCRRVAVPSGQALIAKTAAAPSMGWIVPALTVALLFFAGCGAWLALEAFSEVRTVSIHAHRGRFDRGTGKHAGRGAGSHRRGCRLSRDGHSAFQRRRARGCARQRFLPPRRCREESLGAYLRGNPRHPAWPECGAGVSQ